MQRRQVLATLGATASGGLAGCSVAGTDETRTRPPTDCPSADSRRIELLGTASVPDTVGLSITAAVERAHFSPDGPARLTVTLRNDGDDRALDVTDGPDCHPFDRGRGRSDPHGLWLYRAGDTPADHAEECWTRTADRVGGFDGYGCGRYPLAGGDSMATTYAAWDDHAADGYLSPGTYRFETTVSVYSDEDADDPVRSVDWWFDLGLRNTATTDRSQEFTSSR